MQNKIIHPLYLKSWETYGSKAGNCQQTFHATYSYLSHYIFLSFKLYVLLAWLTLRASLNSFLRWIPRTWPLVTQLGTIFHDSVCWRQVNKNYPLFLPLSQQTVESPVSPMTQKMNDLSLWSSFPSNPPLWSSDPCNSHL